MIEMADPQLPEPIIQTCDDHGRDGKETERGEWKGIYECVALA
jgi:hypothetical protein